MTRVAKAITAFFAALGTWGTTAYADGALTGPEWFGLCGVAVAAFGVWVTPNTPPAGQPADPNQSEIGPLDYDPEAEP